MVENKKLTHFERWRKALLSPQATLEQAINNLNETSLQIVLVVSSDGELLGTITDGDIRRALIGDFDINSSVGEIAYNEPLVAPATLSRDVVLQLMQANQIHQVPIVDEKKRVLGLHLWDEIMSPNANLNGLRKTAEKGNVEHNLKWKLSLSPGTYYASIQAIDAAYLGSAFSESVLLLNEKLY